MYYIMSEGGSGILDSVDRRPDQDKLDEMAQYFECDIYVILGEHTGLTAKFNAVEKVKAMLGKDESIAGGD